MSLSTYSKNQVIGGLSRVDLLLEIYERAIMALEGCSTSAAANDTTTFCQQFVKAQKAIAAIHAGLKPEQDEVAFNVARILHFVLAEMSAKNFNSAIKLLSNLRDGFAAISEEANQLERDQVIPPLPSHENYRI